MFIFYLNNIEQNVFSISFLYFKKISLKQNNFGLLTFFFNTKILKCNPNSYRKRRNGDTRTPSGYPIPVGFGVILFIPVQNWDEFGETRNIWVWGGQNPSPPPIAMPVANSLLWFYFAIVLFCHGSKEWKIGS
jgi:hypothetical protein